MSGGHWNGRERDLQFTLQDVAADEDVKGRFPTLSARLLHLGEALREVMRRLDLDLSGDTCIESDEAFEHAALHKLGAGLESRVYRLSYHKPESGKFYASHELRSHLSRWDVAKMVRDLANTRELPGLVVGHSPFIVVIRDDQDSVELIPWRE